MNGLTQRHDAKAAYEGHSKDYEFGLNAMRAHWQSGLDDIRRTLANPRRVVAEGIETQEEADFLRAIGCHVGQGYLFGKPVEPLTAEAYIRSITCRRTKIAG